MKKKRPIISIVLLVIFFFIPLLAGIYLSRRYTFTTGEDVIMVFTIVPIEIFILIFIIALWRKQNIDEWGNSNHKKQKCNWGDESDYQKSNQYQNY